ncbi:MAG TPA: nuclear transport factor 2 family protein [Acidobacteriaceae bacterium]|nr:nuclear transport factor 2 family protein [Acidobacteriaceae bacterium]
MSELPVQFAAPAFCFDSMQKRGLVSGTQMRGEAQTKRVRRWVVVGALLAVVFCGLPAETAWALPHRDHAIRKHIEALEMRWREAELTNNVSVMEKLLADDYIGISANGTVETRQETLDAHRAGTMKIQSLNITDLKVRVYGNTAVVTSKAALLGENGQSDISGNYRYTRVYNKRLGRWKIVSFEASRMHDVDARRKKWKK